MFETEENCISPAMRAREAMLDWNPSKPLPTNPNYSRYSGKTIATKEKRVDSESSTCIF